MSTRKLVLLIVVCVGMTSISQSNSAYTQDATNYQAMQSPTRRLRRAIPAIIRSLVGAARMSYSTRDYKLFQKVGDYRDALKDFYKLEPEDVVQEGKRRRGVAGDKFLEIHYNKKIKQADFTIRYKDKGTTETVVIQYIPVHKSRPKKKRIP